MDENTIANWILVYFGVENFDGVDENGEFDTQQHQFLDLVNTMDYYAVEAYLDHFANGRFGYVYLPDVGTVVHGLSLALIPEMAHAFEQYLDASGVACELKQIDSDFSVSDYVEVRRAFYRSYRGQADA